MTTIRKPLSRKLQKTAEELEAALTKALQAHAECQGVSVTKVSPLEDGSGLTNWDAEFAASPGVVMSSECKRALLSAKHGIQKRFSLVGFGA
jgi:hypothetical protein